MDQQPSLPAEVRASLPALVQGYLAVQDRQIAMLREQIASLQAELGKIRQQLADARERIPQHSGNASRPPSTVPPDTLPRPKRSPSGRHRGG